MQPLASFAAKGADGIDAAGTARGEPDGGQGGAEQEERNRHESHGIPGLDAK